MTNLSCTHSSSGSPSDQERIDRIKARLATIDRKLEPEFADLKVRRLTKVEIAALPPGLPKSYLDFVRQIGVIAICDTEDPHTPKGTFVPRFWENFIFASGTPPEPKTFLCVGWDPGAATIYGYEINQRPHELVATQCIDFSPYKCNEDSFLGLVENLLNIPRNLAETEHPMKFIQRKHRSLILQTEAFPLPWEGYPQHSFRLQLNFGTSDLLEGILEIFADMSWSRSSTWYWCEYRGITVWPEGKHCRVGLFGIHPDWGSVGKVDLAFRCSGALNRTNESGDIQDLADRTRLTVAAALLKEELKRLNP